MIRNIIFKTLIDILFIFQGFGILGAFIIIPFGATKLNQVSVGIEKWSALFWGLLIIGIIAYVMFMIGLFYLRRVGRYLLSKRYFTIQVVSNLKKSGLFLIFSGVMSFMGFIITWVIKINSNQLTIYNIDMALPFFICIIGLFFIIQSDVLLSAKSFKEENDLTI
jgi:Protein of unknown function (DUF2975)